VVNHALVDAALQFTPLLQANRGEAETLGRMTPAVHQALGHAGIYSALSPLDVGGHELPFPDQMHVAEQLGYADPSVAWCVVNTWISSTIACRMNRNAMERVFVDPCCFYGFGLAPDRTSAERR
jgi:alkylation response protein AidB-like acyl-CoA dehydrogenase